MMLNQGYIIKACAIINVLVYYLWWKTQAIPPYVKEIIGAPTKVSAEKPAKSQKELPEINIGRNDAVLEACRSDAYTMGDIANYFGCHNSTVSRVVEKCKA